MPSIELTLTSQSKDLGGENYNKLLDITANGLEIYSKQDDFPMPWDAVCYIENGFFIIDGDLGQQGNNKAWAKVGIPLDKVMDYIELSIYVEDEEAASEIRDILSEYGWL